MMMHTAVFLLLATAALVAARDAKWFLRRNTVTRVVYQQRSQTLVVPSSCVVVEPSLKPCRHLRQLQPTPASHIPRISLTASPRLTEQRAPSLQPSEAEAPRASWASYLGLGDVTVTQTVTQLVTARMASPAATVTFSVRGCHPTRLPFDLPLCPGNMSTASANVTAPVRSTTPEGIKEIHFVPEQP